MPFARRDLLLAGGAAALVPLLGRAAWATVWNGTELQHALRRAPDDATVLLKPGAYGDCGALVVDRPGLLLRADAPGCVLREPVMTLAANVAMNGLHFTQPVHVSAPGTVVGGCDFAGHGLHFDASATGSEATGTLFHDAAPGVSMLSIGAGQATANTRVGVHVHANRFQDNLQGHQELVYTKSSGNVIEANVLVASHSISCRCGSFNVVRANTSTGGYGIVVQDNDNQIIGNTLTNLLGGHAIFIMAGDMPYTENVQGKHAQAANTIVDGNTGPLVIGHMYRTSYTFPALNTRVSNHTGRITRVNDQGTTITGGSGGGAPPPTARSLSPSPSPSPGLPGEPGGLPGGFHDGAGRA